MSTFDNSQAHREGWSFFNDCTIQRLDHGPILEDGTQTGEPAFAGDAEAFDFVVAKAEAGSEYHRKALNLWLDTPRKGYNDDVTARSALELAQNFTKEKLKLCWASFVKAYVLIRKARRNAGHQWQTGEASLQVILQRLDFSKAEHLLKSLAIRLP